MASTEQERIDAVSRYLLGEAASAICRALGRSRYWLYKWLKRYDPANPAWAIQWHLRQLGVAPLPAVWTINRILRRHGLVAKPRYLPRGTPYPAVVPPGPHHLHQLDLVGPRYLRGGARFYGVHLMDAYSNAVALDGRGHGIVAGSRDAARPTCSDPYEKPTASTGTDCAYVSRMACPC